MLNNVFFIIVIGTSFFSYLLLGKIYYSDFGKKEELSVDLGEGLFGAGIISFYECIIFTFIFALCDVYTFSLLTITLAIKNFILIFIIIQNKNKLKKIKLEWNCNFILVILIVVCFLLYFCFSTEYLWGRRDPIMYVIKGIEIAKNGGVKHATDEFLNQNYVEIKGFVDLTYRGIYSDFMQGYSSLPGDISFQFLDFFPALLAIGYSMAGLDGLFRINSLTAIFCILAIYFLGKRFFGRKAGTIAAIFLALNPAQMWSARITQTELLYQLNWLIGANLFGIGWKNKSKSTMLISGCFIGLIGLNRIDSYILGIGLFGVSIYCNFFVANRRKIVFSMAMGYFTTASISFLYSCIFSFYYIKEHWDIGVMSMLIICNVVFAILCITTYVIKEQIYSRISKYNFIANICDSKMGRIVVCWSLFWITRLLYYARPLRQKGNDYDWDFNQRSFKELCWYTSILAILFAILGVYHIMKERQTRKQLLGFLAMGASSLIVYVWRPAVAPDHLWASRRWISVCIPFILLLAAYGIEQVSSYFSKRKEKAILLLTTISISVFFLYQCRLFLFTPMLYEMQGQYEDLTSHMSKGEIYYAQESMFGSVLRFVYDQNVFIIKKDSTEDLKNYLESSGDTIYYIGDINIFEGILQYEEIYNGEIKGTYIYQTDKEYPEKLTKTGGATNIYKLYF